MLEARVVATPLGAGSAAEERTLLPLRETAQLEPGLASSSSNATVALASSLARAFGLAASTSSTAAPLYPPQPLLLLSNVHAIALDNVGYAEPTGESARGRALWLAAAAGLLLAAALAFAAFFALQHVTCDAKEE